jgi:alpha-tubulin suppressor-like RCC1 family protein
MHAEEPIEIFTDGVEIEEISAGWHHNLLKGTDGKLYGFGARQNGQLDGTSYDGRQEQCSIVEIKLPVDLESNPIVSFEAKNLRS